MKQQLALALGVLLTVTLLTACGARTNAKPGVLPDVVRQLETFRKEHPAAQEVYSLLADLDGDAVPEYAVVLKEKDGLQLGFVSAAGAVQAPENAKMAGMDFQGAFLADRGGEKHLTVFAGYPPQNTLVRVYRVRNGKPELLLSVPADSEARVTREGVQVVSKRFKAQGGYDLVGDNFDWDAKADVYKKKGGAVRRPQTPDRVLAG